MITVLSKARDKVNEIAIKSMVAIRNRKAEGYVDSGVKILIAVVIGALLLGLLYSLFNDTIRTNLTSKINEIFNYSGGGGGGGGGGGT